MKKSLKILSLIFSVAFILSALIGCENGNGDNHIHTFNMTYSFNDTHHWFDATCEHVNEVNGKAEHNYDENFVCKDCDYKHNHRVGDGYDFNDDYHWREFSCGHVNTAELLPHVYGSGDKCLFCEYQHIHNYQNGICSCGFEEHSGLAPSLNGKTFYLDYAIYNDGDGDVLHPNTEDGYTNDFYNITFSGDGKGYFNFAMPIDKAITYSVTGTQFTLTAYRDAVEVNSYVSKVTYKQDVMVYSGEYLGVFNGKSRIVLTYSFADAEGFVRTRIYSLTEGEKLTDEYLDFNDFVGTYTTQKDQPVNYVTVTLKEGNLADYTVYKYASGVATPTNYENCVAICTSVKKSGVYYYVIKVYFNKLDYHEIYFTIDGNLSGAHKVVQ